MPAWDPEAAIAMVDEAGIQTGILSIGARSTTPEGIRAGPRTFSFGTASSATPTSLPSLLAFAEPGRILSGSGLPWADPGWRRGRPDGPVAEAIGIRRMR